MLQLSIVASVSAARIGNSDRTQKYTRFLWRSKMMHRFRSFFLILSVLLLVCSAVTAEEGAGLEVEDIPSETAAASSGDTVFTPSLGSPYTSDIGSAYWTTPMDITDEQAVWDMLMQPITVVDIGKKSGETVQAYLYREPDADSQKVGVVTCESQGVRVIEHLENGWSLVECYSSSFHDTKVPAWNLLVSGYIKTSYLKTVKPSDKLALVVDKLAQRLYVFQNGKLLSTLLCSTGLVMHNGTKYQPYNETRSGEFLLMSRQGSLISDRLICAHAIRFNGGDAIHEVPHVKQADGTKNYKSTEPKLGTKCSHGCIRVQRNKTPEGINMEWIWKQVTSNYSKIKIVIWEDWQGRQLPVPSADTQVFYNPNKGQYYHRLDHCYNGKNIKFTAFSYAELDEGNFAKLLPCPYCDPPRRLAEIQAVNAAYAPGGDHEELLNSLRQDYFNSLAEDSAE